jgi:hypothetical protein
MAGEAYFEFADPDKWSDNRLERRKADLNAAGEVPQSDARAFMIAREGLHLVFEQARRAQDDARIAS